MLQIQIVENNDAGMLPARLPDRRVEVLFVTEMENRNVRRADRPPRDCARLKATDLRMLLKCARPLPLIVQTVTSRGGRAPAGSRRCRSRSMTAPAAQARTS
jgi:hypothetical protein